MLILRDFWSTFTFSIVEVFVWIVVSLNHDWSEITGSEGTLYRFRMDLNLSPVEDELEGRKLTKDTKCNQCDYTSPWIGNLRRHMLTHSGERPCNQCNSRSCTQKFTKCLHCDFFSSHAGVLKKHIITHKWEKHHKCNQCSYICLRMSAIWRDIWTNTAMISLTNAINVAFHPPGKQWGEILQVSSVYFCIISIWHFSNAFEHSHQQKN